MDRKPALALAVLLALTGCSQAPHDAQPSMAVQSDRPVEAGTEAMPVPETVSEFGNKSAHYDFQAPAGAEPPPETVEIPAANLPAKGFTRVRILYATDRQRAGETPDDCYGSERGTGTTLTPFECGQCDVSLPYTHDPGEIERPSIWKLEFTQNPAKHVALLAVRCLPGQQFVEILREEIRQSTSESAFLFVHGFNVEFAEAARRTAQMKYDLGFDGAAIMYSWPAPKNYIECEGNAIWTRAHLVEFLTQYLQESGARKVHLIAHSMGTRVLSDALSEVVQARAGRGPRYNQVILAAPDIDASVFRQQIAPRIVNAADRISIYASSEDVALLASKKAHGYVRLGEGGPNLSIFPDYPMIEVLDATGVDKSLLGHSYYGDSPTILRDLRLVLSGAAASQRGITARNSYFLLSR